MTRILTALAAGALLFCAACRTNSAGRAPRAAGGGKLAVWVVADAGLGTQADAREVKARRQLVQFMTGDLVRALTRAGYEAQTITAPVAFVPAPGRFMLTYRVTRYNPGNKAARIVVGYGAGSAMLDIEYELAPTVGAPVLSRTDGVASGRDWTFCCRKLNQNMVMSISQHLSAGAR